MAVTAEDQPGTPVTTQAAVLHSFNYLVAALRIILGGWGLTASC